MKVLAPGKLILSGEHSVVYGNPALAMAVNRYVETTTAQEPFPFVSFDLFDFSHKSRFSLQSLHFLKDRIKEKYKKFKAGEFHIRDVLQHPVELAQFAFSIFVEILNIKLTQGLKIKVQSDIPIGCGMGSSAATILSIAHAIANHLNLEVTPEMFLRLGLLAENMQHGFSSGLDLQVSQKGGCLYLHNGKIFERKVPQFSFYLINTGSPKATTGECVTRVAHHFQTTAIGDDFAAVTNAMDVALLINNQTELLRAIAANHQLLVKIGVVPEKIQKFIAEIEKNGGVGKICGAGSISGDAAGVLLVVTEDENCLKVICDKFGFSTLRVTGVTRGVHVI